MALKSIEDAQEYIDKIGEHLCEMTAISIHAGLNSHAAVWCTIHAALLHSSEEFRTIVDIMEMYLKASENKYNKPTF